MNYYFSSWQPWWVFSSQIRWKIDFLKSKKVSSTNPLWTIYKLNFSVEFTHYVIKIIKLNLFVQVLPQNHSKLHRHHRKLLIAATVLNFEATFTVWLAGDDIVDELSRLPLFNKRAFHFLLQNWGFCWKIRRRSKTSAGKFSEFLFAFTWRCHEGFRNIVHMCGFLPHLDCCRSKN